MQKKKKKAKAIIKISIKGKEDIIILIKENLKLNMDNNVLQKFESKNQRRFRLFSTRGSGPDKVIDIHVNR